MCENRKEQRLSLGNAWMWCEDCGAKLYDFEGFKDESKPCPTPKECKIQKRSVKEFNSLNLNELPF